MKALHHRVAWQAAIMGEVQAICKGVAGAGGCHLSRSGMEFHYCSIFNSCLRMLILRKTPI